MQTFNRRLLKLHIWYFILKGKKTVTLWLLFIIYDKIMRQSTDHLAGTTMNLKYFSYRCEKTLIYDVAWLFNEPHFIMAMKQLERAVITSEEKRVFIVGGSLSRFI